MAFYSLWDANLKGFTILGGTFLGFEAVPHLKFSGGLMHVELWGEDPFFGGSSSFGGNTLMVGGHYFF